MGNRNLINAKNAKNDEFYTKYCDIESEMSQFLTYDPDIFRGKTVLCPCDDPDRSNFTKYFMSNFSDLGLDMLISTCYAAESNGHGRYLIQTNAEIEKGYLYGNGDFRSDGITALKNEADIVVTNPPFSLFRDFFNWEMDKKFITIGNLNAAAYVDIFPYFMSGDVWITGNRICAFDTDNGAVGVNARWYTNIGGVKGKQLPALMTMADNIEHSRHKDVRGNEYRHYDNYDAVEVPHTDAIPSDYDGMMGVPILFLDYYAPDYEVLGRAENLDRYSLKTKRYSTEIKRQWGNLNRSAVIKTGDRYKQTFTRIFIQKRQ